MKSLKIIIPSVAVILLLTVVLLFPSRVTDVVDRFSPKPQIVSDTVTVVETVTVHDTVPKIVYRERVFYDTIRVVATDSATGDTVQVSVPLPIEQVAFSGAIDTFGTYTATVQGYKPLLKSIEFELKIPTVTVTKTVTNTGKLTRWNFGITAGAGYGVFTRKPDVFVGFGLTYRL